MRSSGAPAEGGRYGWRLLLGDGRGLEALDGPRNMALDHALLEAVKAGAPSVLRLYRWDPPTLSFGRNQPARGLYDRDHAHDRGIALVRRPTGGQAVLHDDELTYAVVAPVSVVGRPRAAYGRINGALVAALRGLGVEAALAQPRGRTGARTGTRAPVDWSAACFRAPAEGEVVAGGRKLVGSAQRTESRVILQHGSILLGGSQEAAESLLVAARPGRSGSVGEWTTVEAEVGERPGLDALVAAVVAGFESTLGTSLARSSLSGNEQEISRRLSARYGSDEWTWRR